MEAFTSTLRAVFALAIVLGLILALAYVLKRYAPQFMARLQAKRGHRRLEVVETLVLDPARRLVLVRLDDEERLILLGEGHELIEPRPKHTEVRHAEVRHAEAKHIEAKPVTAAPVETKPAAVAPLPKPAPRPTPVAAPVPTPAPQPAKPVLAPVSHTSVSQAPASQTQDPNDDLF